MDPAFNLFLLKKVLTHPINSAGTHKKTLLSVTIQTQPWCQQKFRALYNIHLSILNNQYSQQICKLIGVNILLLLHFRFIFFIKK